MLAAVAPSRVLVTGASGFIGGALAARLREAGHVVVAPSRAELDLVRPDARTVLNDLSPVEVVVHCAASRQRSDPSPARFADEIAINLHASALLYDWARASGARAIVHASTLSVLQPGDDGERLLEDDAPRVEAPAHPYALTKRWAEDLVICLRPAFAAAAIVRPGMAYGRDQSPGSGMGRLVQSVRSGAPYPLCGDGGHRYAPVHVDDVVDVLARLVEAPRHVTVTVGGPTPVYERHIVQDLGALLGVPVTFVPQPAERPLSMAPSSRSVDALFPDRARTPWPEGAARAFGPPTLGMSR